MPILKYFMKAKEPIPISGPRATGLDAVPTQREVVWKSIIEIEDLSVNENKIKLPTINKLTSIKSKKSIESPDPLSRRCFVEISRTKTLLFIIAVDVKTNKYHVI